MDVPVERALKRLFGSDASLLFVYETHPGPPADLHPVEVWVLGPGQSLPASARAAVPVGRPAAPPLRGQATYRPADSAPSNVDVEHEQELSRLIANLSASSAQVRREAATALGEKGDGDERALKALGLALQDRDALVRRAAAQALVDIGGPDAEAVLRDALRSGDREVRRIARESLDGNASE
jgi:HEAT repeat protein